MRKVIHDSPRFRRMWLSGMPTKAIGQTMGFRRQTIHAAAKRFGYGTRPRGPMRPAEAALPELDVDDVDFHAVQRVWHGVLAQAVRDAVWWGDDRAVPDGDIYNLRWFDTPEAADICEMAGVCPVRLRDRVHELRREYLFLMDEGETPRRLTQMVEMC